MTQTYYRVGPHTFCLTDATPWEAAARLHSLLPFRSTAPAAGEELLFSLRIDSREEADVPCQAGEAEAIRFDWDDAQCVIRPLPEAAHLVCITPRGTSHTYRLASGDRFHCAHVGLPDEPARQSEALFVLNNYLMMLFAFAAAERHTLLMHASVVVCEGAGHLFLGKSGTGKSTHSRLWLHHIAGSRLLNDDNPMVWYDEPTRTFRVSGTPWSGKTPCYLNEQYPVRAFVRLEQAPANRITRLPLVHAFAALLPSCSNLRQDHDILHGIMDTLTQLTAHVPVYRLQCLPDAEAARLCHHTLCHEETD